ncbi:conserved hypothetical protein,hypothetical protein [Brugia malayi]|uniref:Uncharacterized protein n=1 Tax=Brugia malayi TaxID=6279 RepID=A0A4E9FUQ3_BRUMA|nr:conserved hypothetical protein,hypothetical protein [Brugia malayi]VIO99599.1 conserved hypothetical protein,hypothetical protein [Brugia malayi]
MVDDGSGVSRLATVNSCPGFCGRQATTSSSGNVTYSNCQACSWGHRSVEKFLCSSCDDLLPLYDWLYLLFIALVPLLLNSFFVQLYAPPKSTRQHLFLQHLCCLLECTLSALFSVLVMPPRGTPILYGCIKNSLRDWYPVFYNPVVNHTYTLRCTQEIVFPLYSLPFIYLALCLMCLIIFRSILYLTVLKNSYIASDPYYAALFAIPVIALFHALFAGLLYYSFGYVALVCSLSLNALHMALKREKSICKLYYEMIYKPRNLFILIVHMALFGFSILTLTLNRITASGTLISLFAVLLVPLPSLFYLVTVGITDPEHVHSAF